MGCAPGATLGRLSFALIPSAIGGYPQKVKVFLTRTFFSGSASAFASSTDSPSLGRVGAGLFVVAGLDVAFACIWALACARAVVLLFLALAKYSRYTAIGS